MKENTSLPENFSPIENYKLHNIVTALLAVLKNITPEQIKRIAEQEVMERRVKENNISDFYQNKKILTRSDDDFYINFHKASAWINPRKGDIEIINRTDWNYSNVHVETITPSDLLKISFPAGSKIWDNRLEIIPLEILWKRGWQIWILSGNNERYTKECFYVCLSENKKIEVIANGSWYLSGDFSDMIDNYKPGNSFQVKLTPFAGKTTNVKWGIDVFTPNEIELVDFKEFLLAAL